MKKKQLGLSLLLIRIIGRLLWAALFWRWINGCPHLWEEQKARRRKNC